MPEPAINRMSLDEFLRWDDGTDTRWELFEGVPVAMAPPAVALGAWPPGRQPGSKVRFGRDGHILLSWQRASSGRTATTPATSPIWL